MGINILFNFNALPNTLLLLLARRVLITAVSVSIRISLLSRYLYYILNAILFYSLFLKVVHLLRYRYSETFGGMGGRGRWKTSHRQVDAATLEPFSVRRCNCSTYFMRKYYLSFINVLRVLYIIL